MVEGEIRTLDGIAIGFDCPFCGARMSRKNLEEIVCPGCGAKYTLQGVVKAVIISGPTKEKDEDGMWIPKKENTGD